MQKEHIARGVKNVKIPVLLDFNRFIRFMTFVARSLLN
jgi:hypothetical protein